MSTAAHGRWLPGSHWASQIRHFDSPVLRMRYRGGMVITSYGAPEWDLLARAMVRLPDPRPGLTLDEIRVVDVLTANAVTFAAADDRGPPLGQAPACTPPGWVWAHLFGTRLVALVPAEARGAFRYPGGMATLPADRDHRGVRIDEARSVRLQGSETLPERLVERLEERLGFALPAAYRAFLAQTNGATPTTPGIHPRFGFVVDQPLFGLARSDRHQDLVYASQWFTDRLTADFLAIGYVQGGVLAVRIAGDDVGSVWYLDDDDYRDDDRFDAEYICAHLLWRCADDMDQFWTALTSPPPRLLRLVAESVTNGWAVATRTPDMGASLLAAKRSPGPA